MLGKRGGHAVQRRFRAEGRHPIAQATCIRLADLKLRKEAERRKRLGPPASRHGFHSGIPQRALAEQMNEGASLGEGLAHARQLCPEPRSRGICIY